MPDHEKAPFAVPDGHKEASVAFVLLPFAVSIIAVQEEDALNPIFVCAKAAESVPNARTMTEEP